MEDAVKDKATVSTRVHDLYQLLEFIPSPAKAALYEVHPRIFVGDYNYNLSTFSIKRYQFRILRVGGCLRCITEKHERCVPDIHRLVKPYQFENKPVYIEAEGLKMMGIVAVDDESFPISIFFKSAADFIEETLSGLVKKNVLVQSRHGESRAPTIVVAYLMLKMGMSLEQALQHVGKRMPLHPNQGFMAQLLRLNDRLRGKETRTARLLRQRQNPFPIRTHPTSDITVVSRPEAKPCCALHSFKNIPSGFVYKIVDDRERDESLYTVCAFDRQNF